MSIPTRFSVLTLEGDVEVLYENQTFGTMSYGSDTNDREVWRKFLREGLFGPFRSMVELEWIREHFRWIDTFIHIQPSGYNFVFSRMEIMTHE